MSFFGVSSSSKHKANGVADTSVAASVGMVPNGREKPNLNSTTHTTSSSIRPKDETASFARNWIYTASVVSAVLSEKVEDSKNDKLGEFIRTILKTDGKQFEELDPLYCHPLNASSSAIRQYTGKDGKLSLDALISTAITSMHQSLWWTYYNADPSGQSLRRTRLIPNTITWENDDAMDSVALLPRFTEVKLKVHYPVSIFEILKYTSFDSSMNIFENAIRIYAMAINHTIVDTKPTAAMPATIGVYSHELGSRLKNTPRIYNSRLLCTSSEMAQLCGDPHAKPQRTKISFPEGQFVVYDSDELLTFTDDRLQRHYHLLQCMDWEFVFGEILIGHYERVRRSSDDVKVREKTFETVRVEWPGDPKDHTDVSRFMVKYFIPLYHAHHKLQTKLLTSDSTYDFELKLLVPFMENFVSLFSFRRQCIPLSYPGGQPGFELPSQHEAGQISISFITPDHKWMKPATSATAVAASK